jgi:aryl-alcohol dehydrogenase-like predicted oxidoreductase
VNADPRLVRRYAEQSLRELGTDRIDLYYPHFPDPQVPLADTVGAVGDLIAAGLVRHLGLSNVTADQLREAHAVPPGRGRAGRVVDVAPGRARACSPRQGSSASASWPGRRSVAAS